MSTPRVLIALPEPESRELAGALQDVCMAVPAAPETLQERLSDGPWTAIVADPDLCEPDLVERARALPERPAVVLLAGFGSVCDAVDSMRAGAFDYLSRPTSPDQVALAVHRALDQRTLAEENERLRETLSGRRSLDGIVTRDPAVSQLLEIALSVADTRANVLITGESGTGKTRLARAIHAASDRADGPFVEVNCGALPTGLLESELFGHARGSFTGAVRDRPGKFEAADGGTIFLDEIAVADPELQVKLLRVLQDRAFERVGESATRRTDARVVCATNVDLPVEVAAGRFREDLYYRIHVVALELPPLRRRAGDVHLLAGIFLDRFEREHDRPHRALDPDAQAALVSHDWPGNVRELENVLERAVLLARGPRITPADLGPGFERASPAEAVPDAEIAGRTLKEALEGPEKRIIQRALELNGGNRKETARMLGVNRTTLFNKMRKYGLLDPARGRRSS